MQGIISNILKIVQSKRKQCKGECLPVHKKEEGRSPVTPGAWYLCQQTVALIGQCETAQIAHNEGIHY